MKKMALYAFVCGAFACTCDLSYGLSFDSYCIADDGLVRAMGKRPGRPTSVSEAIEEIKHMHNLEEEIELDLSGQMIAKEGAAKLLDFIVECERLRGLQRLNLAYNRIEGDGDEILMKKFTSLLSRLPNIKAVNVVGNNFVSRNWMDSLERFAGDKVKKLVWLSDDVARLHGVEQAAW